MAAYSAEAFSAAVKDQYGAVIPDAEVEWSIDGNPDGIAIGSNGLVTVTNDAKSVVSSTTPEEFTVRATYSGLADATVKITVKRDTVGTLEIEIRKKSKIELSWN